MTRLVVVCFGLTLLACSDGVSRVPDDTRLTGRIVVQAAGGDAEIAALRTLATRFEQTHPGSDVELVALARAGDHMARLATSFAGGQPPDVFLLNYRRFGQFAAKGVIEPASFGDLDRADVYPQPLEAFTFGGAVLCLPQNASSTVVYYNPTLFRGAGVAVPRAGWSLDDLTAAAQALSAQQVDAIGFEASFRSVPPFVWAMGGEVVDDTSAPTRITLDPPAGRAALRYLAELTRYGVDAAEAKAEPVEDRFARGDLAMLLDSRRAVPALRKTGVDFDVAPLPRGVEAATLLASDGYCVAAASRNKLLAQAFAAYAVGPDGGTVLAETGRTVPSLRSLAESDAFLAPGEKPASARVWLDAVATARRLPNVASWNEAEEAASDVIEQFLAGRFTLDAAVQRIATDSRRLLQAPS